MYSLSQTVSLHLLCGEKHYKPDHGVLRDLAQARWIVEGHKSHIYIRKDIVFESEEHFMHLIFIKK